jgi:hypothetical protein
MNFSVSIYIRSLAGKVFGKFLLPILIPLERGGAEASGERYKGQAPVPAPRISPMMDILKSLLTPDLWSGMAFLKSRKQASFI